MTGNDAGEGGVDLAIEFGIKFELVVDKLINEDIMRGVGEGKVEVLVLGFPGLGDAGEG